MLKFVPLRVREVGSDSEDAVSVTLDVPDAARENFLSLAGQHVVLRAHLGGEELRRTYSLVNAAGELPLRIVARVHPQGRLSRHLATSVKPGDVLEVMPPNGSFGPRVPASGHGVYVAFAAGCGITPVFSIVKTVLEREPARRVLLFYGNRSSARTMLLQDLLALKDRYMQRLSLHFLMSREPQEIELLNGRIDAPKVAALAKLWGVAAVDGYYVSGPGSMIGDVSSALVALGVPRERIHAEHFAASDAPSTPQPSAAGAGVRSGVTQVSVLMDGRRRAFEMPSEGESVLDAAARAGLELPFSCKAGVCSTCRTKLLKGRVEMAQNYALEDWELEQGYILACQAEPRSSAIELSYDEG
jgi:ring-1,2-phenylacetyl-CoA epoxidase subunit PaaE